MHRSPSKRSRIQKLAAQTASAQAESARCWLRRKTEESNSRLVRMDVGNGTRFSDEGDPYSALLWYAAARGLDNNDRLRI